MSLRHQACVLLLNSLVLGLFWTDVFLRTILNDVKVNIQYEANDLCITSHVLKFVPLKC